MNWLSLRGPFEPLAPTHQLADPLCKRYVVASYEVPTAYRLIDSGSFHWCTTFFSTFPHGTYTLSLNIPYLALEDGSPLFEKVFSHFTLLPPPIESCIIGAGGWNNVHIGRPAHINTGLSPSSVFRFQEIAVHAEANPLAPVATGPFPSLRPGASFEHYRLIYFRSPLLIESRLINSPRIIEMFQFIRLLNKIYI